jgi:hypothetical protein
VLSLLVKLDPIVKLARGINKDITAVALKTVQLTVKLLPRVFIEFVPKTMTAINHNLQERPDLFHF